MSENPYIEKLRAMKPNFGAMNIRRLRVFGSQARGDAKPGSDIDILVDFVQTPDLFAFIGLKQDLEERLGISVDLVTPKGLHWALKDDILTEVRDV